MVETEKPTPNSCIKPSPVEDPFGLLIKEINADFASIRVLSKRASVVLVYPPAIGL